MKKQKSKTTKFKIHTKSVMALMLVVLMLSSSFVASGYEKNSADSATPTVGATPNVYTAESSQEILNNENLFNVKTTFYDYHTDHEMHNGWRVTGDWNGTPRYAWEDYQEFNKAVANYARANPDWEKPLYFGNYWNKDDGYNGLGQQNFEKFFNKANNSARLTGGFNISVTGLVNNKLDSNGNLLIRNSNAEIPFFNDDFILSGGENGKNLGTIVKTNLPMRKETSGSGNTYYEFNSSDAQDNVWFTGYGDPNNELTINYGSGTNYGVYDALNNFSSPKESNGYGFLPFDSSSITKEGVDFGFGMKVETNFTLPTGGIKNNEHMMFNFTGDDDVWVFVDGVLVLDLGGDHKKANGSIDFATKKSKVTTGTYNINDGSEHQGIQEIDFPNIFGENDNEEFDNNDTGKVHKLTLFYMERGKIESNLKFSFNFQDASNKLLVGESVILDGINEGIISEVTEDVNKDILYQLYGGVNVDPVGHEYTQYISKTGSNVDKTIGSNKESTLLFGDNASFYSQFEEGETLKIDQIERDAHYSYDTSYTVTDLDNQTLIKSGDYKSTGEFLFDNTSTEFLAPTEIGVSFKNKIITGGFLVQKEIYDEEGSKVSSGSSDKEFNFNVSVKLPNSDTFEKYRLKATKTDTINGTSEEIIITEGNFTLRARDQIKVTGLPSNTQIKIIEKAHEGYFTPFPTHYGRIQEPFGASEAIDRAIFRNYMITTDLSYDVKLKKTLDGAPATNAGQFTFKLLDENKTELARATNDANGNIIFKADEIPSLNFDINDIGVNTFYIEEVVGDDSTISYDETYYRLNLRVIEGSLPGSIEFWDISFIKCNPDGSEQTTAVDDVIFKNTTKKGSLTVNKVDDQDNPLPSTQNDKILFKLVPATVDTHGNWSNTQEDYDNAQEVEIDLNGKYVYNDLEFGNYLLYETKARDGYHLQKQATKVTIDGNNLNKTVKVVNVAKTDLPLTGASTTGLTFFASAIVLISIAFALTIFYKKRKVQ